MGSGEEVQRNVGGFQKDVFRLAVLCNENPHFLSANSTDGLVAVGSLDPVLPKLLPLQESHPISTGQALLGTRALILNLQKIEMPT